MKLLQVYTVIGLVFISNIALAENVGGYYKSNGHYVNSYQRTHKDAYTYNNYGSQRGFSTPVLPTPQYQPQINYQAPVNPIMPYMPSLSLGSDDE